MWIHGDLLGGNLLVRDGRLSAVIDWGPLKVGDPAPDVAPAWTLFEGEARRTYRERLAVDDATWARARAWVMLPALAGIRYYEKTVPAFSQRSRRHFSGTRSWGMSVSRPLGDASGCRSRDMPTGRATLSYIRARIVHDRPTKYPTSRA